MFPDALIQQEVSTDQWIDIPGAVIDVYRLWRTTPLFRATRLEQTLQTPAHIYFKYEGGLAGRVAQAQHGRAAGLLQQGGGIRRSAPRRGPDSGDPRSLSRARLFGMEALVYMVKASYEQKPYRRIFMETFGATVHASPSDTTQAGKGILSEHPDSTGSLGIAISEAVEVAATNDDTNYALGSVLNHVLLHQTVVGLEAKAQMALTGEEPDVIDRLRRWRLELRRHRLPVHGRQAVGVQARPPIRGG